MKNKKEIRAFKRFAISSIHLTTKRRLSGFVFLIRLYEQSFRYNFRAIFSETLQSISANFSTLHFPRIYYRSIPRGTISLCFTPARPLYYATVADELDFGVHFFVRHSMVRLHFVNRRAIFGIISPNGGPRSIRRRRTERKWIDETDISRSPSTNKRSSEQRSGE